MSKKIVVRKKVFNELYKSVQLRFGEILGLHNQKQPKKVGEYHGFIKSEDPNQLSLMQTILQPTEAYKTDADLKQSLNSYLQEIDQAISWKRLYNLSRDAAKQESDYGILKMEPIFLNILAKYVGYEAFEAFVRRLPSIDQKLAEIQLGGKTQLLIESFATGYLGFYYSAMDEERKCLRVTIDFYNATALGYPCQIDYFRDQDRSYVKEVAYTWILQENRNSSYFSATLKDELHERPMTLLGYKGY